MIKVSKKGKVYVALDTWAPDPNRTHQEGMAQTRQETGFEEAPGDNDIPF